VPKTQNTIQSAIKNNVKKASVLLIFIYTPSYNLKEPHFDYNVLTFAALWMRTRLHMRLLGDVPILLPQCTAAHSSPVHSFETILIISTTATAVYIATNLCLYFHLCHL
jgi:hypothetical protein